MATELETKAIDNTQNDAYALPVSFAQQRLWFLQRLEPESSAYHVSTAFRLRGELDVKSLQESIDSLVLRHEVLRTTFGTRDSEPVQIIHSISPTPLSITDLRKLETTIREETLRRLLQESAGRPFDLDEGPLFRVGLVRMSEDEHVLLLNMHHIITDGWSTSILFRELSAHYNARRANRPCLLPDLPVQYGDYAIWQRERLSGEEFRGQLNYWKNHLENLPMLQLPTDRPRPTMQTYRGASHSVELSTGLSEAIKAFGRHEGATLFMLLLAAFQTLLFRYCGQDVIVVGTPIAGRTRQETEGLIGFFVNTLVLRTDLSNDPPFRQLLARVRQVSLDAYDHQDIPFEKLVEELNPTRSLSISPLFQVMFSLQNTDETRLHLDGLSAAPIRTASQLSKFDLTMTIAVQDSNLRASLNYNIDLFDASTIERMLGHFRRMLEGIVADPNQRISELPLLSAAEKHQLLLHWNDTRADYLKDRCIHQLFEAQVEKAPDAIAVVFEEQQVTYRELNNRANQLGQYLQKLGVGPEALIGICLERSIEMIVGLLAILKAGGAYLPLDPSYPKDRLDFMLDDAKVAVLLTQERLLPFLDHPNILCLDRDWNRYASENTANPQTKVTAENLAYVIYTSGSTGLPKGIMIAHRNVVNFLASMACDPGLKETDVLLSVTTLSFDIAGLEIYLPLTVGARVVLARREVTFDGGRLAKQLSDCSATVMQATPATWCMLLAGGWQGSQELKILCGGDALPETLATQLGNCSASLWNMYGPTETTIWSSVQSVPANFSSVNLGRPIANTQVFILDPHLNPVPIGVPGELHIGGDGLARGYLNRPELTAEKFIANAFSNNSPSRLYKTGDLARYLPDGNIEFLGRIDNQVKIRGFRVELGEIEAVLGQHPTVQSSVVVVREDTPGDKRLMGYVVARPQASVDAMEVRKHLKQKLPEYMIPSTLVLLDSLPLTPNGKVDRNALPAPDKSRAETGQSYTAPRTPVEQLLAKIWAEVLKLDQVGVHDNFFEVGGHSLLATQIVSQMRNAFFIDLPLRRLFETPTVAEMAVFVMASQAQRANESVLAAILHDVESRTEEEAQNLLARECKT